MQGKIQREVFQVSIRAKSDQAGSASPSSIHMVGLESEFARFPAHLDCDGVAFAASEIRKEVQMPQGSQQHCHRVLLMTLVDVPNRRNSEITLLLEAPSRNTT
jgi:hypothetical protein